MFSKVDFPDPLGPVTTTTAPGRTTPETFDNTVRLPNRLTIRSNSTLAPPTARIVTQNYHAGAWRARVIILLLNFGRGFTAAEIQSVKQITFGSVISSSENATPSRPSPEFLMPPNGIWSRR